VQATRFLLSILLLAGAVSACSGQGETSPLGNSRPSPEALGKAALEALTSMDEDALAGLMVTRQEYESLLWPSLPDRDYMPFDFVWSLTGPRSRKARQESLVELGGVELHLVRVDLGEDIESYGSFTLYREARMTVRRGDTGEEGLIALMDVLVQMGGGWKFLNFAEDV